MESRAATAFLNVLIVSVVLLVGWTAYHALSQFSSSSTPHVPATRQVSTWRDYAVVGERIGPTNPPVVITVFADYQCPFCRRLINDLRTVGQQHPTDVAIVYRQFPLRTHMFAYAAARAALCAAQQQHFEAYHYALFRYQDSIGLVSWTRFAAQVHVRDTISFNRCLTDSVVTAQLATDIAAGKRLGVTMTPTILINGTELIGDPTAASLSTYIDDALKQPRRL